ncbi:MAG: SDR family oxidoreductase [Luteibaculum sp.]
MKILVTGANGLLGQRLIQLCLDKKIEVYATGKGESRLHGLSGVSYKSVDITDAGDVKKILDEVKPDAVVNTAALTHVDDCEKNRELAVDVNVNAVKILAEACLERDVYLCHISTDFIFDGEQGMYSEEDEPNPVNFYGETKLMAEEVLHCYPKLKCSILRTILVFGFVPNLTRTNIILWLNDTLAAGKPVNIVTDQFRTPTFADDLAAACLSACELKAEGIYNVGGSEYISIYDLAQRVARVFGHDKNLITPVQSERFSDKAPRPPKTGFSNAKAREELKYTPHSLNAALEKLKLQIQDFNNNEALVLST